jgi:hypothetical protein
MFQDECKGSGREEEEQAIRTEQTISPDLIDVASVDDTDLFDMRLAEINAERSSVINLNMEDEISDEDMRYRLAVLDQREDELRSTELGNYAMETSEDDRESEPIKTTASRTNTKTPVWKGKHPDHIVMIVNSEQASSLMFASVLS